MRLKLITCDGCGAELERRIISPDAPLWRLPEDTFDLCAPCSAERPWLRRSAYAPLHPEAEAARQALIKRFLGETG